MTESRGCSCFGRVAVRIGLITPTQLERARAAVSAVGAGTPASVARRPHGEAGEAEPQERRAPSAPRASLPMRGVGIAEALVEQGALTPHMAARVYEVLHAGHACRHKSRGAA